MTIIAAKAPIIVAHNAMTSILDFLALGYIFTSFVILSL